VPTKATALTAVHKLELSKLDPKTIQKEMMGEDFDLGKLNVYLQSKVLFDSSARVIDVNVNRTIDGASTLDLLVDDYDRTLLKSKVLNARLDIEIDGLWFRLVKVSKDAGSDQLTLGFEQREIALLRTYPKHNAPHNGVKFASRDKTTRAEFILNLIREVKEVKIPVVIPHLKQIQPITKAKDTTVGTKWGDVVATGDISGGIPALTQESPIEARHHGDPYPKGVYLTVKGVAMVKDQRNNANTILTVAKNMNANRKVCVCAIMTAIQESTLHNLSGGDGTSVGLFQQTTYYGSYADRHDPATSARMFLERCIKEDQSYKGWSYNDLCQNVQRSGHPDLYGQWQGEANAIVTAFGIPPGKGGDTGNEGDAAFMNNMSQIWSPTADNTYYYMRGTQDSANKTFKREDNWTCIRRLADEVGWRAFFIGGVFYYLTDDDLFKTQPIVTVTESTAGVQGIGFDYDLGKKGATVDMPCQVGLWLAPPGSIIVLQDMGPITGRWCVNNFSRSLFDDNADVNLTKPQPTLPEPLDDNIQTLPTWAQGHPADPSVAASTDAAMFGGLPGTDGSRKAVVMIAQKCVEIQAKWPFHYAHAWQNPRPYPDTLFSAEAHSSSKGIDCSSFVTLCYKEAGAADPNGAGYSGNGYTGTLATHGAPVPYPSPGDLVFYGSPPDYHHVALVVGGGNQIQIGGDDGVKMESLNGPGPPTAYRSYLPL